MTQERQNHFQVEKESVLCRTCFMGWGWGGVRGMSPRVTGLIIYWLEDFSIKQDFLMIRNAQRWDRPHWTRESTFYYFARAAVTEYNRLGSLNNRNLFLPSSAGWMSELKVSTGLISAEASFLG